MGKHDRKEERPYKAKFQEIRNGIDDLVGSCEFYKARINTLEKRIAELEDELKEAQLNVTDMAAMYEHSADTIERHDERNKGIIERKDNEIARAKEAIYLAAMREAEMYV